MCSENEMWRLVSAGETAVTTSAKKEGTQGTRLQSRTGDSRTFCVSKIIKPYSNLLLLACNCIQYFKEESCNV